MTHGGYRIGAGRKKGLNALEAEKARELICKILGENLTPIVEIAVKQAKEGDKHARQWLFERAYGKAPSIEDDKEELEKDIKLEVEKKELIDKFANW